LTAIVLAERKHEKTTTASPAWYQILAERLVDFSAIILNPFISDPSADVLLDATL
jgi:hypothetical protein